MCGHKKALHLDGMRCQYIAEWKNPDSTWVSTTVCICQNFKSKSTEKIISKEAVTIPNEQTP